MKNEDVCQIGDLDSKYIDFFLQIPPLSMMIWSTWSSEIFKEQGFFDTMQLAVLLNLAQYNFCFLKQVRDVFRVSDN